MSCNQGKRAAARALLAPLYAQFTEGFATRDLRAAKALLDHLGQKVVSAIDTPLSESISKADTRRVLALSEVREITAE